MSERQRVNISISAEAYTKLQTIRRLYGFRNACEVVVAFVRVLLDQFEEGGARKLDLPEDDAEYIRSMFSQLANTERTPDGTVPVRHRSTIRI